MPYSYMEHVSDVGVRAEGKTLEEAMDCGAEAVLNVMFSLETIERVISITFGADAPDLAALFVEVLNETLSIQDRHCLAFKGLRTQEIKKTGAGYVFIGAAFGEPFDREKHEVKTDVKAATYSGLKYYEKDGLHVFECVIDV
ncbi:MAG: archease [Thermodesulfobacteriota bacterium]